MRASEARTKLCHLGFAGNALVQCRADECMAWRVYRPAGSTIGYGGPLPEGFEEADETAGGIRRIRATEDHGDCHALPPRPDE